MAKSNFITLLKRLVTPPLYAEEEKKRITATLIFLLSVLLTVSLLLVADMIYRRQYDSLRGLLVAVVILILSLWLTLTGRVLFPSYLIPIGILAVNTYMIIVGTGIHDIAILGLPLIIALSSLLLGWRGALLSGVLSTICLAIVYFYERAGEIPKAIPFAAATSFDDLIVMGILLIATAILLFFTTNNLTRSLQRVRQSKRKLRRLNKNLEQRVAKRTSELQTANEHLATLTRVKDEFVTNISHELRTPITSIMLYHNLLENKPENALVYVKNLKRETGRLAHLIEDLLTLSRLDQQRIEMNYALVSVNQLIQEYVLDRTPLAAERGLKLNIEDIPDLPQVQADEKMLGQVLSILLTNAFNYTPPGGTVTVRALMQQYEDQAWIGIAVSDTGPGIPAEEHERVFERFYRGKSGRESNTAGTGLGLSIANEIIQRHHGHIELQSEGGMGRGATFTFWLPVPPPI